MKNLPWHRLLSVMLALILALSFAPAVQAKTDPAGETVGTALFYIVNNAGEEILVSRIPVSAMESDMAAGRLNDTLHNYSLLDRFVTTVHQEAQGFTVGEFVTYAQSKSGVGALKDMKLTFNGVDKIRFWEIDQSGFDDLDTYTYNDLYGVDRYNFPLLYQYWNYSTQDYYDPSGKMSKETVIDHIFANGQSEVFLLSVRAFSQRYIVTEEKYNAGDFNLENYWRSRGLLDNERTIRVMKPMTKAELYSKTPTAADTRYWVANIMLDMAARPAFTSLGAVAAPTAVMTEDADNYYIRLSCNTSGATILYNHNYVSPSYTPTSPYGGTPVIVPKTSFKDGTVTMTARAVKDGYTDAGVVTLKLKPSGAEQGWSNPFSDVNSGSWYYDAVEFVMSSGLFDATGTTAAGGSTFSPNAPMTRAMLVTALYRHAMGEPGARGEAPGVSEDAGRAPEFADVPQDAAYYDAVMWAYQYGVVTGTSATTFAPDNTITREQIVTMFYRYAEKLCNADMSPSSALDAYTDAAKLSAYAVECMKWGIGAKLINGMTDTTIAPQGTATRAQVATLVMRLADYIN